MYFDNYFNVSLSIKDKLDMYIERNTESSNNMFLFRKV